MALCAFAAGCTSPSAEGTEGTFAAVLPADTVRLVELGSPLAAKARTLPDTAGRLMTPHHAVQFRSVLVTRQIDAATARASRLGRTELHAAPGRELVLAVLSPNPVQTGPRNIAGFPGLEVTATVVAGDRTTKLPRVPKAGEAVLVSTRPGTDVRLRLFDAGRTQSLGLRDGARGPDAIPAFDRVRSADVRFRYRAAGLLTFGDYAKTLTVSLDVDRALLEPWLPPVGWARAGRMWLQVSVSRISSDGATFDPDEREFAARFTLAFRQTFTLLLAGGAQVVPRALPPVETAQYHPSPATYELLFDVPETTTAATLRITPNGPKVAVFRNGEVPVVWRRPPATRDVPIPLAP